MVTTMSKPRFMLRIEVLKINEDGEVRDTFVTYTTELAIEDAQEADWLARCAWVDTDIRFIARADSSPVTPHEGG